MGPEREVARGRAGISWRCPGWAMIELGRGKAQLAKSKEASIYDSAFVEPKKYSLKDDKDLNMNPSYITSGAELFTSYSILYF